MKRTPIGHPWGGASIIACNGSAVQMLALSLLHDRQGAGREASSAISRTRSGQKGWDWDLRCPLNYWEGHLAFGAKES